MNKELSPLSCPNCGAPINRATMRCEYCGTVFREDRYKNLITIESPHAVPLIAEFRIPFEFVDRIGDKESESIIRNELLNAMKSNLMEQIDIVCEEEPLTWSYRCIGRLRVVPPNYKFYGI